jgi:hypothetical protein
VTKWTGNIWHADSAHFKSTLGKTQKNVLSNSTIAVLMDALGNQGVRRLRQVMSDRETREDLVQVAQRMFEVYPQGLCPTIAHDILELNAEYYLEREGSQR